MAYFSCRFHVLSMNTVIDRASKVLSYRRCPPLMAWLGGVGYHLFGRRCNRVRSCRKEVSVQATLRSKQMIINTFRSSIHLFGNYVGMRDSWWLNDLELKLHPQTRHPYRQTFLHTSVMKMRMSLWISAM